MKALVCLAASFLCALVSSCAHLSGTNGSLEGTWLNEDRGYYFRVYPDATVAQWPSPPVGDVSWSRHLNGELQWGEPSSFYRRPRLERRGRNIAMIDSTSNVMILHPILPDLEPGVTIKKQP